MGLHVEKSDLSASSREQKMAGRGLRFRKYMYENNVFVTNLP